MKAVEVHLPQDVDKSFIVFRETGDFFPAPWHYHPHYEFVLINESTGRRMVGDHIGYFQKDDLVFMGSLLPHVWVNDPIYLQRQATHKADALVIHFTDDFLGEFFMNIPEMKEFRKVLKLADRGLVLYGETRQKIITLIKQMPAMNGLPRLSALLQIFDIMSNTTEYDFLASPRFVQNFQYGASDRFKKITGYIMQNFDKDISLSEIAAVGNMGVTAFCNFFKEQFRVTFVEYLTTVRIGHACKLLSEHDRNIVEVAYECGFNNLANFNRQFKKLKGMTPSDYRKTLIIR
ncbi:AraC family transcriptional regulator [Spirosoma sp. BT702]|uniref:AraC family transcriptional regulator n=1 Tax=Spirosoma profusum TaxID=2771354 RepID=A0A927AP87_9BACT|nr:AraC family transcriptional regulator [Spirosoma profusum]MBD2703529.1 AraC family transcriptional regulator [Spirosoma profusum]